MIIQWLKQLPLKIIPCESNQQIAQSCPNYYIEIKTNFILFYLFLHVTVLFYIFKNIYSMGVHNRIEYPNHAFKRQNQGRREKATRKVQLNHHFISFLFYLPLSSPRELEVVKELYGLYEYSMLGCADYFDELVATCNFIVYYFEFWFLFEANENMCHQQQYLIH